MSTQYDLYLKEHINNVKKAYGWMRENLPYIDEYTNLNELLAEHDASKYTTEEYDAYDSYFYGGNKSYAVTNKFNKAWLHHIHYNPHHWQHWVLINDDSENGTIALDMPYRYIIEMICDWLSFSFKIEDFNEFFKWYDDHKDYMILSDNTRDIVEDIVNDIKSIVGGSND